MLDMLYIVLEKCRNQFTEKKYRQKKLQNINFSKCFDEKKDFQFAISVFPDFLSHHYNSNNNNKMKADLIEVDNRSQISPDTSTLFVTVRIEQKI